MNSIVVRTLFSKKGFQIGYEVYNFTTETVVVTYKNRDFGGVAFWRRAKAAADAYLQKHLS